MTATTIIYNGVTITNVLTDDISQDVVQESSGVNPIYVRVVVSCTGIVHMSYTPGVENTIGIAGRSYASVIADSYNLFIDNLMQPRRPFKMLIGATTLFDVIPGYERAGIAGMPQFTDNPIARTDVNHGPIPSVRVIGVVSGNTMKIQFKITMHLPYTDTSGQGYPNDGAISFRFWIAEDIDCDDFTTERTYEGTFRVRHLGHNVLTQIRQNFSMPPLVEGFQRKRIALRQRPNGLELDFTITDKEKWAMPPFPATHWEGHQTMFTPQPGGFLLHSELYVSLRADKKTPKLQLLQTAARIFETKLHKLDRGQDGQTYLQSYMVKDTFTDNRVELSGSVQLVGPLRTVFNLAKGNFCRPLDVAGGANYPSLFTDYNKDKMRAVVPTACIKGLFLASLQDPLHVYGFPNTNEVSRQITYGTTDCPEIVDEPNLPNYEPNISDDHKDNGYTMARMRANNRKQHGTIQLPFGKASGSQNQPNRKTAVLLQMHQPIANLRVLYEAERLRDWPTIPSAEDYAKLGANFAPIDSRVISSAPVTCADSVKTAYHVVAELYFGQDAEASAIPAGLLPYRQNFGPLGSQGTGQTDVFAIPNSVFSNSNILFA